jgi:polar amino acid transport system substrate-binding protein
MNIQLFKYGKIKHNRYKLRQMASSTRWLGDIEPMWQGRMMQISVGVWIASIVIGAALSAGWVVNNDPYAPEAAQEGDMSTPLRVGYAINPPYADRSLEGRISGESPATLKLILHRAGYTNVSWVHVPWPELIHELQMGRIDVIAAGLAATPQRQQLLDFTRPTVAVHTGLLVRQGNPLDLHALKDLRDRPTQRLALVAGSAEEAMAREAGLPPSQLLLLPDAHAAASAVRNGQAAALMQPAPALRWATGRTGTDAAALALADPFEQPLLNGEPGVSYAAFALRPGDPRRLLIDQTLVGLLGSAEQRSLIEPYGFTRSDIAEAARSLP